jgi:diacylglycerol kinase (ATP)
VYLAPSFYNMPKPKIRFIANPFSGAKKAKLLESYVHSYLDKAKYDYDIVYTEYAGHAITLAKEAVSLDYFAIVAAGGDGTLNEVATSIANSKTSLGIIPLGSGNGFSYHIGVGRSVAKAFELINSGRTAKIDIGFVNDRPFVNVAGLGLDAVVAYMTKTNKRRGFLPYMVNTIKYAANYSGLVMTVETDDGRKFADNYMIAAVANGSIYGYDFAIAPIAKLDDGLLDVVLVKKKPLYYYVGVAFRMLTKSLHKSEIVTYFKCKSLVITFEGDTHLHVDGEGFRVTENLNFRLEQKSLNFLRK